MLTFIQVFGAADDDTPVEFDKQSWDRVIKGAGEIEEVIVQQGELIN
ncbi:hypothetical protein ACLUWI_09850 [Limosilactobacillus mucosae]